MIGGSVQLFDTWGSGDALLYADNSNFKPDSSGITFQIDATPWGTDISPLGPALQHARGTAIHALHEIRRRRKELRRDRPQRFRQRYAEDIHMARTLKMTTRIGFALLCGRGCGYCFTDARKPPSRQRRRSLPAVRRVPQRRKRRRQRTLGPNLFGVVGSKRGFAAQFAYSAALKNSGIVWTDDKLKAWVLSPQKMVPGTKMILIHPLDARTGRRRDRLSEREKIKWRSAATGLLSRIALRALVICAAVAIIARSAVLTRRDQSDRPVDEEGTRNY